MIKKFKGLKNRTKGAIVAGLAAAVLAGGAGSFALWQDTVDVVGAQVTLGTGLTTVLPSAWTFTVTPAGRCPYANPMSHAQFEFCNLRPGTTVTSNFSATLDEDFPLQWQRTNQAPVPPNPTGWTGGELSDTTWTGVDLLLPSGLGLISMSRTWNITDDVEPGTWFTMPTVLVEVRATP